MFYLAFICDKIWNNKMLIACLYVVTVITDLQIY